MLNKDPIPTTIAGIKSLASDKRKSENLKHTRALDVASQRAGYKNFRHAKNRLSETSETHYVLLTIYWQDRDRRELGRETLKVVLSQPLLKICSKQLLRFARGFGNLRMVASDHLVCDDPAHSQSYAREMLCTAERSIRFMENTGLQPLQDYRKAYGDGLMKNRLPNSDHTTDWVEPSNGSYVLIDEPYQSAVNDTERLSWAAKHGWFLAKTKWAGMYFPHSCDLYVASRDQTADEFDDTVRKINSIPKPMVAEDWVGDSVQSWETFTSPNAKTKQDQRRAKSKATVIPMETSKTVPYSFRPGTVSRRPNGRMEVDRHIYIGKVLKAVLSLRSLPYGAYRRLNSLRSTLEDWLGLEIGRKQLNGPDFFEFYYSKAEGDEQFRQRAETGWAIIDMLNEIDGTLRASYPDCAPLRLQLHRLKMARSIVAKIDTVDV